MLAGAGLLLGATTFGWFQHIQTVPRRDRARINAGTPSTATPATNVALTGGIQAAPATTDAQATKPTRDPMNSAEVRAFLPASADSALSNGNIHTYGRRRMNDAAFAVPLPPPPDASAVEVPVQAYAPETPPVPLPEAVRLVGVMDGKAIFTVPADVASRNNVTTSFTLGPGQKYAGITVQDIKKHSVTICDGKSICIKSLSDMN
jgi:hypothetical protein